MSITLVEDLCLRSSLTSCEKQSACASLFWFSILSRPKAIAIIQPGKEEQSTGLDKQKFSA